MLSVQEALNNILQAGKPMAPEPVPIAQALGRILAQDIKASIDVPPADNSAMDGYALKALDRNSLPANIPISQRIPAGCAPEALLPGTAARIFTGGILPEGADTVVMQENCVVDRQNQSIEILQAPYQGENVRQRGLDVKAGSRLFSTGHKLRPQDLGLLASVGIASVNAYSRPTVALVGTGDELVEPGTPLAKGQIYNSNKIMLKAMVQKMGCDIYEPPQFSAKSAIGDTLAETQEALENCAGNADLIVTTGGVSVGEEDYVKPAIQALGELHHWKVKLKPGKPLVFAQIQNTLLLGLPGNPVSAFVTWLLFVAPLLRKMMGLQEYTIAPQALPLLFDIPKPRQRPEYLRVRIQENGVVAFDNQSSGLLTSTTWADALALIPENQNFKQGDLVKVYMLDKLME